MRFGVGKSRGFPAGETYAPPELHSALDQPKTSFEKADAALDKRLARLREESQDPANPSNWRTAADPTDLKAIKNHCDDEVDGSSGNQSAGAFDFG